MSRRDVDEVLVPNLSADELTEFRTQYIRDQWTAPATGLSHYNRATKSNFFADAVLEAIHDRISTDFAEELLGVYDSKYYERIAAGDEEATATAEATSIRKQALFRLMRAECREMMMEDPGFAGSIADEHNRTALFTSWKEAIARDRTFARTRSTAAFAAIPLERF